MNHTAVTLKVPKVFRLQADIYIRHRHLHPALRHTHLELFPQARPLVYLVTGGPRKPPPKCVGYLSGPANTHTVRLHPALRRRSPSVITVMDEVHQLQRF